ncbi:uncharacterized protein ASCRUDRAFT_33922 [Ascoidea rubescens DSM 1968]|uniref:Rab proteins geranylgeranyltransferase component A n=1 Tax=Ascoidea rubescens DSM 1968 TaxID=1344418 RepID=A0A1D2VIG4_9ASCO|nr:hypothetical protein ASCRUDRAFT_33922 [Ascoidea rubescens DSM 1968]ODV61310.1 hypothetical protein ASCRUDRAFT_33922 [Ascoidea rubescens DSM 1968]
MSSFNNSYLKTDRRSSMAERRPSNLSNYNKPFINIPQLACLELPPPDYTPDNCDVLIIGTGLVESILAAALAWQGSNVLHIDSNPYYGDTNSTLTIDQIKDWVKNNTSLGYKNFKNARLYIPRPTQLISKNYGIDLNQKLLFCKSDLLSLLLKSRVFKYLEFQSLSQFHTFENDNFEKIINSKQQIFVNNTLPLKIKRNLMKFLKFIINNNSNNIWFPYKKKPISLFLKEVFHLETAQINEFIFAIGLCFSSNLNTPEALQRIKRYIISFDVYGNFPVLYTKYGGPGEVSQGFCRSAAVAGTTYKLNTSLVAYDPIKKMAKLSDDSLITINEKIVISPTQIPNFLEEYQPKQKYEVSRLITIVNSDCKEWMAENESACVVVFPENSLPSFNKYAVQVVIMGEGSEIVPKNQCAWFLSTIERGSKGKIDLESALSCLEQNLLRESKFNADDIGMEYIGIGNGNGMGYEMYNSLKLGSSLMNFVPEEKLTYLLKFYFTQKTSVPPFGVVNPKIFNEGENEHDNIIFNSMPSSELSYDGVVTEAKVLYEKITGSDDDFFDIDFEDENENENEFGGNDYEYNSVLDDNAEMDEFYLDQDEY